MQISSSFASTRSFFKTGKFRSRKQKTNQDSTTSTSHTTRNTSIDTTHTKSSLWRSASRQASIPDKQFQTRDLPQKSDIVSQQARKSDDTMRDPVKVVPPFQALPTTRTVTPALLDENEYRALGLFNSGSQRLHKSTNASRATSPGQLEAEHRFELEVPMQVIRERRPDLQVKIPLHTPPSRSPRLLGTNYVGPTPPSAMSTPSTIPTGRNLKSATTAATPRSVVSPLTGLEMPRPHRPFSTDSLEDTPTQNSKYSSKPDTRQQPAQRSRRPSTSSELEAKTPRPGDTPVISNGTAVRFDAIHPRYASPVPGSTHSRKEGQTNLHPSAKHHPVMHRKGSAVSIASQININKPLPPEPPANSARQVTSSSPPKHIAYSTSYNSLPRSQLTSRSPSTTKLTRTPQLKSEPPSPESQRPGIGTRRGSQSSLARSTTLRSKYTPKDLDSMDEAFQRRTAMNSIQQTPNLSKSRASPEQSQLSLVDTNYLHTITESSSPKTVYSLAAMDEPLQISRGPMRMEPSRSPPQVPPAQLSRVHTIDTDKSGRDYRAISRTQSNTSIRTANTVIESHPMPPVTEAMNIERRANDRLNNLSKADRILGLTGGSAVNRQIFDNQYQASEVARSPGALLDDSSDEDFYEVRGRRDAHFEEIQSRLKLLSATDDPAATFDAFHEENIQRPKQWEEELREEKKKTGTKPTIEEKLHLTGTLQDNPIVPTFIAELEANRTPSPVELQGSHAPNPILNVVAEEDSEGDGMAELGVPSPEALAVTNVAPTPAPTEQSIRRGRAAAAPPLSTVSGTSKSLHSARSMRVQSLASIAASDIPDFYAHAPRSDSQSKRPSTAGSEYDELLTTQAAERVLLHILQSLDNLEDLFAAARVSKGFYRTFKRNELYLLKHAIWKMSPAAWELREMSIPYAELPATAKDYTPSLYFTYYVQDLLTMVELKAMILESCKSFLRPETISGLTGETEKSPLIDDAFWRVWTFCRIFGCNTKREEDIVGQMDWLRGGVIARQSSDTRTLALTDELARNSVLFNPPAGFAKGNGLRGLTAEQLYDMIEIWTCLGVLVRGYHGKRQEARDYGIYDRCNIDVGDVVSENAMLEEWTNHLLTLAPSTVLDVTSPATPTRTQFAQARSQGYTKWVPPRQGMSRSTFLKEAVSRVYEETMAQRRPAPNTTTSPFSTLVSAHSSIGAADAAIAAKARIQRHQAEIRKQKEDPDYKNLPVSDDRPLSNYSDVLDRLEAISAAAADAPPMPKLPGLAARLSRARSKGNAATTVETPPVVRPNSPTSTIQSSVPSMQSSLPPGQENLFTADVQSSATSGKLKSKIKHPFQMKKSDTSTIPTSPAKAGVGRFASIRNHKLLDKTKSKKDKVKQSESSESLPRVPTIVPSDEKFAVLPEDEPHGGLYFPSQARNPVDPAVETLVGMGFEEESARKALVQTAGGNVINFEAALSRLKKDRERKKRLERLDTMG